MSETESKILIIGNPISKKRPRFANRGKYVAAINDQQTEEGRWILEAKMHFQKPPIKGPVEISLIFGVKRPKGHYGTGRNVGTLKPGSPIYCMNDKDIDNYVKFALDCMNYLVYEDDRQVVKLAAEKIYTNDPYTEVTINEL